ncbi:MHYT domain-containing protein [Deinococcus yunweiensis]|uniref:MHYT domain-containing protein n=1 Tax=Deinococcus yunweiensis TaxID=367282 RepID=UPI00398EB255
MEHSLIQTWNPGYIGLSYVIATLTSFVSLELASRAGRTRAVGSSHFWVLAQALLLGYGIWAMHFIGMLALHSNMPSAFNLLPTILSGLAAVALVYPALRILHAGSLSLGRLALAGTVAGTGIVVMHYLGMAAYRIPGTTVTIMWVPLLASVAIAVGASMVALFLFGLLASDWAAQQKTAMLYGAKTVAALVMGVAITGMHYTGMAALRYTLDPAADLSTLTVTGADAGLLALVIGVVTFLLIGLAVTSIAMDVTDDLELQDLPAATD